jgi:hypothetical protein
MTDTQVVNVLACSAFVKESDFTLQGADNYDPRTWSYYKVVNQTGAISLVVLAAQST